MRTITKCVWSLLAIMMMGLVSCGDDDELNLSADQIAYMKSNREYIWQKKAEKDENGQPKYKTVVVAGDTALYRIVEKKGEWTTKPNINNFVHLLNLEGKHIDGKVFQKRLDKSSFRMNGIISGLAGVLMEIHLDETVETIIPASLGYGFNDYMGIPGGSTLIFTFTLDKVE